MARPLARRPGAFSRTSRRAVSTSRATGAEHAVGVGSPRRRATRWARTSSSSCRIARRSTATCARSGAGSPSRVAMTASVTASDVRSSCDDDRPPGRRPVADRRRLGQPALELGLQLGERPVVAPAGAAAVGGAAGEGGLDERVEREGGVAQRLVQRRPPGLRPQQVAEDEHDRAADEGVDQPRADQARAAGQRQVEQQDDHRRLEHREQPEVGVAGPGQQRGERRPWRRAPRRRAAARPAAPSRCRTPSSVPAPRWTARVNTDPKSGLSTIATVSSTQ